MNISKRYKITDIKNKKGQEPIICLTAYTYPIAKILDNYCDIILVGDSLGMTIYGMENTLSVTVDMVINHAKCVVKATKKSFILVDLPYGSYETSKEQALETAKRIIAETGCDAVKLETPAALAKTVEFLVSKNIPVVGHVGLMPQHINEIGSYKYQGRTEKQIQEILNDAKKIYEAGAFMIVIEGVVESLARKITEDLPIPTIGIGASPICDGQVLVIDDMIGLNREFKPKFVKSYSNIADQIEKSVKQYSEEVRSRKFPAAEHLF